MTERDGHSLLRRLRDLFTGENGGRARPEASLPNEPGGRSSDCEEIDDISCSEAVERVYEYLDRELDDEEAAEVRCHIEKCKRCYPMYDWERMFLELIRERGRRPEKNPKLRRTVESLLDREMEG